MKNVVALLLCVVLLSACETLEGFGNDLDVLWADAGAAFSDLTSAPDPGEGMAATKAPPKTGQLKPVPCPPISVMEELKTFVEFQNLAKPTAKTEVGQATMTGVVSRCSADGGDLEVSMDVSFDSKLGPKARVRADDKPNFAFPYFVAVTSADGNVLAKEIFAASLAYEEKGQKSMTRTESISQHIPLAGDGSVPDYKILIGFQLSEEQLAYNRSQAAKTAKE